MFEIVRIILFIVLLLTLIIASFQGVFSTNPLISSVAFSVGGTILNLGSMLIAIGIPNEKTVDVETFLLFLCRIGKDLFRISGIILVVLCIVQFCRYWTNKNENIEE